MTEQELADGFAALDVHCSVYNDFSGLSSLMLKSVAAGVPVVVGDQPGWARATVNRFGIGHAVNHGSIETFSRVLRDALEASAEYAESPAVGRLMRFHSIANFTEGLVERAAVHAGKTNLGSILTWAWVMEAIPPERRQLR